jgi:uncharacterized protein (TIGR00369 family)
LALWDNFAAWPDKTLFPTFIGVVKEEIRTDYCRLRLPYRPELNQLAGVVHGGALATLVDTVVVPAVGAVYETRPMLLTISMNLNYLSAVRERDAVAEGWVERRGRSTVFCRAEVRDADWRVGGDWLARVRRTFSEHLSQVPFVRLQETFVPPSRPVPTPTPETQHFWEGTRAGELRLQRCSDCAHAYFPPRPFCPKCSSRSVAVEGSRPAGGPRSTATSSTIASPLASRRPTPSPWSSSRRATHDDQHRRVRADPRGAAARHAARGHLRAAHRRDHPAAVPTSRGAS